MEEGDYRHVSKAEKPMCVWTPCVQNKGQPLTLAGRRDSSRSNDDTNDNSDWPTTLSNTFGYKKDDGRGCERERERERVCENDRQ